MTAPSKSESLTRILLLLVPATAWVAFPFFSDFSTPKLVVAGLLGAALLLHLGSVSLLRPAGWIPVAFLVASLPACLRGPDSDLVRQALVLEILALAAWWGAAHTRGELERRLPSWLLAAGLGVLLFRTGEWLWPGGPFAIGVLDGASTLGNPDLTAEFLGVLLPLALWRLWQPGKAGRVAAAILGIGTIPVLVTHHSLTAWAVGAGGLVTLGLVKLRPRPRARLAALAAALLVGSAALFLVHEQPEAQGRLFLYETATTAALEAPLAGHGEGAFGYAYMSAQGRALEADRAARAYWTNARHGHNLLLHTWVGRGLVPALLLLPLFGFGLWRARKGPAWHLPLLLGALVSFLGSVSWGHVTFRLLAYALLGMAWSIPGGPHRGLPFRRGVAAVLAAIVVIVPLWHAAGDVAFGRGDLEWAHEIVPGNSRIQFALGQQQFAKGENDEARRLLESSIPGHPNLSTPLTLGNLETHVGNFAQAEKWYRQVIVWKPDFAAAYANLAWLYHRWGKESLSDRHLTRALSLRPSDPSILRIRGRIVREREPRLPGATGR